MLSEPRLSSSSYGRMEKRSVWVCRGVGGRVPGTTPENWVSGAERPRLELEEV